LKTGAGRLVAVDFDGTALTSPLYLQFHDAVAVPAAGTRCRRYFPVLAGSLLVFDDLAMDFTTGIVVTVSSTRDTYTVVADLTNAYFTVTYR
jgi:hypothetical protein